MAVRDYTGLTHEQFEEMQEQEQEQAPSNNNSDLECAQTIFGFAETAQKLSEKQLNPKHPSDKSSSVVSSNKKAKTQQRQKFKWLALPNGGMHGYQPNSYFAKTTISSMACNLHTLATPGTGTSCSCLS
jgi:hypothetical protein